MFGPRGAKRHDRDPALLIDLMRFKPDMISANAWAVSAGVSRTVWTDIRRHANPSRRTLEKLLAAAGSSLAEFEALRIGMSPPRLPDSPVFALGDASARPWRGAPLDPIPLLAVRAADGWSGDEAVTRIALIPAHETGSVDRPASLARDLAAYGVAIADDAMAPRFRRDARVIVAPGREVTAGDDVLVHLSASPYALLKQLIVFGEAAITLRQHRPERQFDVPLADITEVHLIIGEAI